MDQLTPPSALHLPDDGAVGARKLKMSHILALGAAILAVLAVAWWGLHWWQVGRFMESTEDAYLSADNVAVMPRITGYVSEVPARDNQAVHQGDVLVRIDDSDYKAALAQAEADVAQAQAALVTLDAQIAAQQAAISQRQADITGTMAALTLARQDWTRYQDLAQSGVASRQRADLAAADLHEKEARHVGGRAALEAAQREIEVLRGQHDGAAATLKRFEAALDVARLNLSRTIITAPVAGVVGDRSVRVGQLVMPGSRLLTVVPVQDLYLLANFKETQIAAMHPGAPVTVVLDTFPDLPLKGEIDSLSPGSGAQFALLPPENATGNFVKIVQRVPVKIRLHTDAKTLAMLRPGLSATATVDTR